MRRPLLATCFAGAVLALAAPAGLAHSHTSVTGLPPVFSPVVGYITITTAANAAAEPTVTLHGHFNDPLTWQCFKPTPWNPALPYSVTCLPRANAVGVVWECSVLHADITTHDERAMARTSMDCDGDGTAEAQTKTATGATWPANRDFQWASSGVQVRTFVCTVDNGAGLGPVPRYTAGCGDPGLPHL